MPDPVALDELPDSDGLGDAPLGADPDTGKVPCPECDRWFLPTGIKRHITMTHRGGVSDSGKSSAGKSKPLPLAIKWAGFQRGAALMVSFACTQCAMVLVQDADKDGQAIAAYCANRPKLTKQVNQLLDASDVMILVG